MYLTERTARRVAREVNTELKLKSPKRLSHIDVFCVTGEERDFYTPLLNDQFQEDVAEVIRKKVGLGA